LVIESFLVVGTSLPRNRNPKAAYSPYTDEFLVTFECDTPGIPASNIRASVISASQFQGVQQISVNRITQSEHHPVIANNVADGTYLIVWNNGTESENQTNKRSVSDFEVSWDSLEVSAVQTERHFEIRSVPLIFEEQTFVEAKVSSFVPRQTGNTFIQATSLCPQTPGTSISSTMYVSSGRMTNVPTYQIISGGGVPDAVSVAAIVVIVLGVIVAVLIGVLIYFMVIRPRFRSPKFEILTQEME